MYVADDDLDPDDCATVQELWLGPPAGGSEFATREGLQEAWTRLRDIVMAMYAKDGRRPMGWWQCEAPGLGLTYPGDEREQSYLYDASVLPENERAELLSYWRGEFERAYAPGYGAERRRKHFREIDLPRSLRRKWTAERKRRAKAIHKLTKASELPQEAAPTDA
jgi:hypothetical protein